MSIYHIIGNLHTHPRGKRLQGMLGAAATPEPPDGHGVCLAMGQDYQSRTPEEQRQWLAWAAQPGCVLLLLPPFRTAVRHQPGDWQVTQLESPPVLSDAAHEVLRLTIPEIHTSLAGGLSKTQVRKIDGGCKTQLSGIYRKHPDSGVFAATTLPAWSLALADHVDALKDWLSEWQSLAGNAVQSDEPNALQEFEPSQAHFSVMLYLASSQFPSRIAAIEALAWNDTFELNGENVPSMLDDLERAGYVTGGVLTEAGYDALIMSPYRCYADALLHPN